MYSYTNEGGGLLWPWYSVQRTILMTCDKLAYYCPERAMLRWTPCSVPIACNAAYDFFAMAICQGRTLLTGSTIPRILAKHPKLPYISRISFRSAFDGFGACSMSTRMFTRPSSSRTPARLINCPLSRAGLDAAESPYGPHGVLTKATGITTPHISSLTSTSLAS